MTSNARCTNGYRNFHKMSYMTLCIILIDEINVNAWGFTQL